MKKILLILCLIMFSVTAANAEYATITPQVLTKEDTPQFEKINYMAAKLFTNIPVNMRFKLGFLPANYENQPLINDNVFNNDNAFNCVQYKQAQLDYSKETGKLEKIRVNKDDLLPARANYDYPSGKLTSVEIYDYNPEKNIANLYVFDAKGKYVDLKEYSTHAQQQIRTFFEGKFPYKYYDRTRNFVKVIITVDRSGKITRTEVFETSGDEEADKMVVEAINNCELLDAFPNYIPLEKLHYVMSFPTFKSKI